MSALSYKFGQVEGTPIVTEENNDTVGNIANTSDDEFNVRLVQIRKRFHKSLDINQPPQTELNDQSYFSMRFNYETDPLCLAKEMKKRNMVDRKVIEHDMFVVDMEQKLSLSVKYLPWWKSISSSSSFYERTCISSILDSDKNLDNTSKVELPSLVLMGCTHCHIYVMVSGADPKCPKCNSSVLLDVFRGKAERI